MPILAASAILLGPGGAAAQPVPLEVPVLYLEREIERPPVLSNLTGRPEDEGLMGVRLAIEDNNTTGSFLGQAYFLQETIVAPDEDWPAAIRPSLADGARIVIVNAPAADLLALADLPEAADDLIFNIGAPEVSLRSDECRANVLHTLPDRLMLSDALMQFLLKKRWTEIMLVEGNGPGDKLFAEALNASAVKFGLTIAERKSWLVDSDIRRNAGAEVPLFTQGEYDVLVIADESGDYAPYFMYNTWLPRPVAGSEGLVPTGWAASVEQWGAAQLQSRFGKLAGRPMNDIDYAGWVAARAAGEVVTRLNEAGAADIRAFLLSEDFQLAAFKGAGVSFRPWNGQLRQPIPLVHPRAMVALAPIEGFLHHRTEFDTLGLDLQDSRCEAMQ